MSSPRVERALATLRRDGVLPVRTALVRVTVLTVAGVIATFLGFGWLASAALSADAERRAGEPSSGISVDDVLIWSFIALCGLALVTGTLLVMLSSRTRRLRLTWRRLTIEPDRFDDADALSRPIGRPAHLAWSDIERISCERLPGPWWGRGGLHILVTVAPDAYGRRAAKLTSGENRLHIVDERSRPRVLALPRSGVGGRQREIAELLERVRVEAATRPRDETGALDETAPRGTPGSDDTTGSTARR